VAVRALVFDVFGTLVDWRSGIARAFRESGLSGDAEQFADAWRGRYAPILKEVNAGARPWGNFDELHRATLDDVLAELDLALDGDGREQLVQGWHRLDPWPDVRDGLQTLRRDRVTAALSNGHTRLLIDLARHGDLRFDCLISAEMAHAYKPAPEVYETAARLLDLTPAEVMLVAAHPWDLKGARAVGMPTALIERPLEHGPGSPARTDPQADVTAASLDALAASLGH
jgi:2-haloacid dehalogenase